MESRERLLRAIILKISQSDTLQEIFDTACAEICQFIRADRVAIFKFDPDAGYDDGTFVAESVMSGYDSVLTKRVQDHSFGDSYAELYFKGKYQALDDIYAPTVARCHIDILEQFQVRANLVIPLSLKEGLWGLLCIHQCGQARHWDEGEVDLVQQLAQQLVIGIQKASLLEQLQHQLQERERAEHIIRLQANREKLLRESSQRISQSMTLQDIFDSACAEICQFIQADRVAIFEFDPDSGYDDGIFVAESVTNGYDSVLTKRVHDHTFGDSYAEFYFKGKYHAIDDIHNAGLTDCHVEILEQFQIHANLVIPLSLKDRLWGLLCIHQCRQPRRWDEAEIDLVQQLADQLVIGIQQASLLEQLQHQLQERERAERQLSDRNEQLTISNIELARATRLKDEFLANMSHELRNPLNAILGMAVALQEEVFGPVTAEQRHSLETVERSGNHLLELINDILDLAKIESGKLELELAPAPVIMLCQSSLTFVAQMAANKHITLEEKLPDSLPHIVIDERRIRQVLINLLNNAVKFTPPQGRVTLEVQLCSGPATEDGSPQNWIQFAVIDTGIGIEADRLEQLFQPFVQVDSALNRKYNGTGLGLALVKRIVELHSGQVEAKSEADVGSCFTIYLPLTTQTVSQVGLKSGETQHQSPQHTQTETFPLILLAEDDEANIALTKSYLVAKGYRVSVAVDGQSAIAKAQSEKPDLILMDIQMPGVDGLEAMRRIRSDAALRDVPIIALTALAMKGDREICLAAGANDYLCKPVNLRELMDTIQRLLRQRKT